jgi:hypothetical protein
MQLTIKNWVLAAGLSMAAGALCALTPAQAADVKKNTNSTTPNSTKAGKAKESHPKAEEVLKAKAKAKGKKAAPSGDELRADDPSEPEPDITDTKVTEYACELNNKVTIYEHEGQPDAIALRWKKRLHRLTRVSTTTGAHRFENKNWGLIWIGIPAKGLLLDSRLNRQLANECKSPEQLKAAGEAAAGISG